MLTAHKWIASVFPVPMYRDCRVKRANIKIEVPRIEIPRSSPKAPTVGAVGSLQSLLQQTTLQVKRKLNIPNFSGPPVHSEGYLYRQETRSIPKNLLQHGNRYQPS